MAEARPAPSVRTRTPARIGFCLAAQWARETPPFREAPGEREHFASKRLELTASAQPLLRKRSRNGLSTNRANPTTTKFKMAVNTNTRCQPPLADLMRLATGTRKADAPLAV